MKHILLMCAILALFGGGSLLSMEEKRATVPGPTTSLDTTRAVPTDTSLNRNSKLLLKDGSVIQGRILTRGPDTVHVVYNF